MVKRTFEFDSFGPWILEIKGKHRIPPLFIKYENLIKSSHLTFKIPRKIERRKANPDMHLYDKIVSIFNDHILILKRDNDDVITTKLFLSDIKYIARTECLLLGKISFFTADNTVDINYNTVSYELITSFLAIVRSLQPKSKILLPLDAIQYNYDNIDTLYYNLLKGMKITEPDNILIAIQPSFKIKIPCNFWKNLLNYISNTTVFTSAIFIKNSDELIIIDRSTQVKGEADTTYSYTFTYIPLDKISSISIGCLNETTNIQFLTILLDKHEFKYYINNLNSGINNLFNCFKRRSMQ